jgi:nucleoside-diphosphate-sugar epimerase
VYGVSDLPNVTEDHPLLPLTLYNKYKGMCEPLLFKHTNDNFVGVVFRPATVCGYGPRQRLDLSVNILTNHAVNKKKITVFGGDQVRPNIHIEDITDVYLHLIDHPEFVGIYNAGFENISILHIAQKVAAKVPAEIMVSASNDPRSYRQNSDKLLATGFVQYSSVADAIDDVIEKFKTGEIVDSDQCYTVRWMKHLNLQS